MLIAEFSYKGEEIEIGNELWQHDYGQKIQIKGLDLPEPVLRRRTGRIQKPGSC